MVMVAIERLDRLNLINTYCILKNFHAWNEWQNHHMLFPDSGIFVNLLTTQKDGKNILSECREIFEFVMCILLQRSVF